MKIAPLLPFLVCTLAVPAANAYTHNQIADEMSYVPAGDLSAVAENFLGEKRVAWRGERVLVRVKTVLPENAEISAGLSVISGTKTVKSRARAEYVRSTLGQGGKPVADIVEPEGEVTLRSQSEKIVIKPATTPFKIRAGEAVILVSADIAADENPGTLGLN